MEMIADGFLNPAEEEPSPPVPITQPGDHGTCCAGQYCLMSNAELVSAHKCTICKGWLHGKLCGNYSPKDVDRFDCSKCVVNTYGVLYMKALHHLREAWEARDLQEKLSKDETLNIYQPRPNNDPHDDDSEDKKRRLTTEVTSEIKKMTDGFKDDKDDYPFLKKQRLTKEEAEFLKRKEKVRNISWMPEEIKGERKIISAASRRLTDWEKADLANLKKRFEIKVNYYKTKLDETIEVMKLAEENFKKSPPSLLYDENDELIITDELETLMYESVKYKDLIKEWVPSPGEAELKLAKQETIMLKEYVKQLQAEITEKQEKLSSVVGDFQQKAEKIKELCDLTIKPKDI